MPDAIGVWHFCQFSGGDHRVLCQFPAGLGRQVRVATWLAGQVRVEAKRIRQGLSAVFDGDGDGEAIVQRVREAEVAVVRKRILDVRRLQAERQNTVRVGTLAYLPWSVAHESMPRSRRVVALAVPVKALVVHAVGIGKEERAAVAGGLLADPLEWDVLEQGEAGISPRAGEGDAVASMFGDNRGVPDAFMGVIRT